MGHVRVAAGIVLVLAVTAWSGRTVRNTVRVAELREQDNLAYDETITDRNAARIRGDLPARGTVGFRDAKAGPNSTQIDTDRRHALVQYALVPLIVARDADRPVVVEVAETPSGPELRVRRTGEPR
jgi:hypothetical protein